MSKWGPVYLNFPYILYMLFIVKIIAVYVLIVIDKSVCVSLKLVKPMCNATSDFHVPSPSSGMYVPSFSSIFLDCVEVSSMWDVCGVKWATVVLPYFYASTFLACLCGILVLLSVQLIIELDKQFLSLGESVKVTFRTEFMWPSATSLRSVWKSGST